MRVRVGELEVDGCDDEDGLVEGHVQLAQRRRVVAHEGVHVLQRLARVRLKVGLGPRVRARVRLRPRVLPRLRVLLRRVPSSAPCRR